MVQIKNIETSAGFIPAKSEKEFIEVYADISSNVIAWKGKPLYPGTQLSSFHDIRIGYRRLSFAKAVRIHNLKESDIKVSTLLGGDDKLASPSKTRPVILRLFW